MLKKIDHVNIVVNDLEAAKRFFVDLLGSRHIAFEVAQIDEVYKILVNAGVRFVSGIKQFKNKRLCYFYGPEEILLEICQYG